MKYLTGILAFGVPCELNSCGLWNISYAEYSSDAFQLVESDDSPFKDYGIEKDKIVPYHEELVNVANHIRAYLDLMVLKEFDYLEGSYMWLIGNTLYTKDIFNVVCKRLIGTEYFDDVNRFLEKEFGSLWKSFYDQTVRVSNTN